MTFSIGVFHRVGFKYVDCPSAGSRRKSNYLQWERTKLKFGIVIPTLNAAPFLNILLSDLLELLPTILEPEDEFIFVVVDDGSQDETVEVARRYKALVILQALRLGYGPSLCRGLDLALKLNCDAVAQCDADHAAEAVACIIGKFLKGTSEKRNLDLVIGQDTSKFVSRSIACWLIRNLLRVRSVSHPTCGLRVWSRHGLECVRQHSIITKDFAVQAELLMYAENSHLAIAEMKFNGHSGGGVHSFEDVRLVAAWLKSFVNICFLKIKGVNSCDPKCDIVSQLDTL